MTYFILAAWILYSGTNFIAGTFDQNVGKFEYLVWFISLILTISALFEQD